jgi:two-component system, sensor histidine kinase and response regulator
MDLQMPGMDGFAATRLLRAQPQLRDLPIIAMTAHVMTEEVQRCLEVGMNDHVGKPINPDAFFATLARWTRARPQEVAQVPARAASANDEISLPDMEGVDVRGGLERIAGNRRLYRDLLAQFVIKQGSAAGRIQTALASGDRHQAERVAHTLKGAAGNLGITQIFYSAANLETAIRESGDGVEEMVKELASALDRQARIIQERLKPAAAVSARRDPAADAREISVAIARLKELLEGSDADAPQAYAHLGELLQDTADPSRLDSLAAAVNAFDFETALVELNEIAKQYGANQK